MRLDDASPDPYPPLAPAIRRLLAPVYDYTLVTEPLSAEQRRAVGWAQEQGIAGPWLRLLDRLGLGFDS